MTTVKKFAVACMVASGLAGVAPAVASAAPSAQVHHTLNASTNNPIVVLGARLDPSCLPPEVLQQRVTAAAEVARQHPLNPVIVTGGVTQKECPFSEAQAMEAGLRLSIVPNRIIRDDAAGSTVENARNVARLTGSRHAVLVTNRGHMARAQQNFADVGLMTTPVDAD